MGPWNKWYHCMGNTYGTWLPGDQRGFRTERHRRDVPYDYKHRPPDGLYDSLLRRSKALMRRTPVYLASREQRFSALVEFVASLLRRQIPVAVASIDRVHFHLLVRLYDRNPRHWIGIAKRESSHYCKRVGHAPIGGLWAEGCECKPVSCDGHYGNTVDYIAGHAKRGAVVYMPAVNPVELFNPMRDFDPIDLLVE